MCPPCLQSLGNCTDCNNSQEESNRKRESIGQRTQSWPCCGPTMLGGQRTQSWLGHLTGRGCARQRSRKQEARTLSQDLNVFRKWPRREEGECLSESSKQKPGHWPGSRRRHGLDNSEPILESLRASMWPPPWVWRSSDREPAPVCETPASPALCPGLAGRAGQGTESQ